MEGKATCRHSSLSLIIPTHNRAGELARALEAVSAIQTSLPWELIVVDNGSTDATAELLEAFARSSSGFDTNVGPATPFFSAHDWELIIRMGASGWAGGYFPAPTVSHDHGRKPQEARQRIYEYNLGIGAVYSMLIRDRRTRRIYVPRILGRILGNLKYNHRKILTEIYGAFLYLRRNDRNPFASLRDEASLE